MNYDKIIVELLGRIQILEEKVGILEAQKADNSQTASDNCINKISTKDIKSYIEELKDNAKKEGLSHIVLKAGDIHKQKQLKSAMPMVCNAMRQCMNDEDRVVFETPSGYSSTLEIEYHF